MYLTPLYERPGPEYIVDLTWLEQFNRVDLEKKYIYWLDGCPRVSSWKLCGVLMCGPSLTHYVTRYMRLVTVDQLSFRAVNGLRRLCALPQLRNEAVLQDIILRVDNAVKSRQII